MGLVRAQTPFQAFQRSHQSKQSLLGQVTTDPHLLPRYPLCQQMGIPNPDPPQPCFLRDLLTPQGMGSRGGWKVNEIELWVEGQEGIGDLRAHGGDKPGNAPYFIVIDISRDQQRACD